MATVGHTLMGLSLGGLCRAKARNGAMPYIWPGLVVLMAHLVDLVEWTVSLVAPETNDNHFLTHSPLLAAGLTLVVWIVIARTTRLRRPLAYLIVALAIFSHLVLDHPLIRTLIADASGLAFDDELPRLSRSILAEVWLYGLLLVGVMLLQGGRRPNSPRRGRVVCGVLGLLAIAAAATRKVALWGPVYLLAAIHAALLMRRDLRPRLLWSLLPLTPLLVFLGVEIAAARLSAGADSLRKQGDYDQAIEFYRRALDYPTRSSHVRTYVNLSQCYQKLGRPAAAEAVLREAQRKSHGSVWPEYWLAHFYANPRWRGSPFFRPQRAAEIFRRIRDGPAEQAARHAAATMLRRLRQQGLIE